MRDQEFSAVLLKWYDRSARVMPWRVSPSDRRLGVRPDPYRVWLSEVMLQQTTVAAVRDYFHRFIARWPTVTALAAAEDADVMGEWAGLGYYARARNLLKCARVVSTEFSGVFPDQYSALIRLPGVGPYTAAAVSAIAFDQPETVVDGNVERVMARLFNIHNPLPTAKPELTAIAARLTPADRAGDYAQAVMDLGATVCTPKSPSCGICPLIEPCLARSAQTQSELPRKLAKPEKPTRHGIAYLARRADGAWLIERRPDRGLLGGMLGWPGSDWGNEVREMPPIAAIWQDPGAEVRHTFTHFHLRLSLRTALIPQNSDPDKGFFLLHDDFRPSDLPTVMRKAYDLAAQSLSMD